MSQDILGIYQFSYGVRGSQLLCNYPTYLSNEESRFVPKDVQSWFRAVPVFLPSSVVGESTCLSGDVAVLDKEVDLSAKYYQEVTGHDYLSACVNVNVMQQRLDDGLSTGQRRQLDGVQEATKPGPSSFHSVMAKLKDMPFLDTSGGPAATQQFSRTSPHALGILSCDALLRVVNSEVALAGAQRVASQVVTGFGNISFVACSFSAPSTDRIAWMQPLVDGITTSTHRNTLVVAIRSVTGDVRKYQRQIERLCHELQQAAWMPPMYEQMRLFSQAIHAYLGRALKCEHDSPIETQMLNKVLFTLLHDTLLAPSPLVCLMRCVLLKLRQNAPVAWEYLPARWSLYLPAIPSAGACLGDHRQGTLDRLKQHKELLEYYTCVCDVVTEDSYLVRLGTLHLNEPIASVGFSKDIVLSLLEYCTLLPVLCTDTTIVLAAEYKRLVSPDIILTIQNNTNAHILSLFASISEGPLTQSTASALLHEDNRNSACFFTDSSTIPCSQCSYIYKYLFRNNVVHICTYTYSVTRAHAKEAIEAKLPMLTKQALTFEQQITESHMSVGMLKEKLEQLREHMIVSRVVTKPMR